MKHWHKIQTLGHLTWAHFTTNRTDERQNEHVQADRAINMWLLTKAVVLLPLSDLLLRTVGFTRLCNWLGYANLSGSQLSQPTLSPTSIDQLHEQRACAQQVARIVAIAAKYGPYRATCLRRSLVLWWLLQQNGIHTEICIGVQTGSNGFAAHAWVEYQGEVLNDRQDIAATFHVLSDAAMAQGFVR